MFILKDKNNKRIEVIKYQENEGVYLFKSDQQEFPLLAMLDGVSDTAFGADNMTPLIAELRLAQSEAEIKAVLDREEAETSSSITRLQIDLKRYSRTMWSIEAEKQLHQLQQRLQKLKKGEFRKQMAEDAISHIDMIISMARRCRENEEYVLVHNPFGG
jgi:hypothetical protein